MKYDIYDLMDAYDGEPVPLRDGDGVSARRIKRATMQKINRTGTAAHSGRRRSLRTLVAAAAAVLCLCTAALAVTTDVFDGMWRFLTAESDFGRDDLTGAWGLHFTDGINAGEDLGCAITNADTVLIANAGQAWELEQGQRVTIQVEIQADGTKTGIGVGYARSDDAGEFLSTGVIVSEQIIDTGTYTFTAPESGCYYFYFANVSAGEFTLETFTVS